MTTKLGSIATLAFLLFVGPFLGTARAGTGALKVISTPPGAEVSVAGRTHGRTPVLVELSEGPHKLVITRDGYAPVRRNVVVKRDQLVRTRVTLKVKPGNRVRVHRTENGGEDAGPATVTIATNPAGLTVFMNDLIVPQPTPVVFDIRAGIYRLSIEQDGSVVFRKTVFVRVGRTLDLDLDIKIRRRIDDSDPWE